MYESRWPPRTLVGRGLVERVDECVTLSATAGRCHATLEMTTLRKQVQLLIAHDEDHLNQIVQTVELVGRHRGSEQHESARRGGGASNYAPIGIRRR